MNFNAFWISMIAANPHLGKEDTKVTMTVSSLKKQMQRAFDKGYEHRNSLGEGAGGKSSFDSFREMLGMK